MHLFDLPVEILDQICECLDTTFEHSYWGNLTSSQVTDVKTYQRLCLVSRRVHAIALLQRYRRVVVEDEEWLVRFYGYIKAHPSRAPLVKDLTLKKLPSHSGGMTPLRLDDWKLFYNLKRLRLYNNILLPIVQVTPSCTEYFPSLESCIISIGRNRTSSRGRPLPLNSLLPFWCAPRLRTFHLEDAYCQSACAPSNNTPKLPALKYLSFRAVQFANQASLTGLFAIRKSRHISLRSVCTPPAIYAQLLADLQPELVEMECHELLSIQYYDAVLFRPLFRPKFPQILDKLRVLKVDLWHLFGDPPPSFPNPRRSLANLTLSPLPESVRQIHVDIETQALYRGEVPGGILVLIHGYGERLDLLKLRLVFMNDLRCYGPGAVQEIPGDIERGRSNWGFSLAEMHEFQAACDREHVKLVMDTAWHHELKTDPPF